MTIGDSVYFAGQTGLYRIDGGGTLQRISEDCEMATMIKCPACVEGLIDRTQAEVNEHMPWVRHLFAKEICTKCGGSGMIKLDNKSVNEPSCWPSTELREALQEINRQAWRSFCRRRVVEQREELG